jgi:hypothetical protein
VLSPKSRSVDSDLRPPGDLPRLRSSCSGPIGRAMPNPSHILPRPLSTRLIVVFAALALLLTPLMASAKGGGRPGLKVRSAKTVTHWRTSHSSCRADSDGDGLSNWTESYLTRTNPYKFDTDGDGYGDGVEVMAGSDPRNRASVPRQTPPPPPEIQPRQRPQLPPVPPPRPFRLALASISARPRAARASSAHLTPARGARAFRPRPITPFPSAPNLLGAGAHLDRGFPSNP